MLKSLNLSHNEFGDIAASVLGQALGERLTPLGDLFRGINVHNVMNVLQFF